MRFKSLALPKNPKFPKNRPNKVQPLYIIFDCFGGRFEENGFADKMTKIYTVLLSLISVSK